MKTLKTIIFILLLGLLIGCQQLDPDNYSIRDRSDRSVALTTIDSKLAEVTTPRIIRELNRELAQYQPQVKIAAPKAGKTFNKTDVAVLLTVEDLPIFQDNQLNLGNHVNLIVDNEPLQTVSSLNEPIIIKNLAPGTHTIRAFAVRPWGESFKNQGAYAQTTFNVLTETNENRPNPELPLLTYSSPTGTYGAEPMLLDYFVNSSKKYPKTESWRIRATVNGNSFIVAEWQPYYLTGFEPGENWVQLELIDSEGKAIENTFNNTVRVFNYDPQRQDTLAKLIENDIVLEEARKIVKQDDYIQPVAETPEIIDFEQLEKGVEPRIIINDSDMNMNSSEKVNLGTSAVEKDSEAFEVITPEEEMFTSKSAPGEYRSDKAIAPRAESSSKYVISSEPISSFVPEKTQIDIANRVDAKTNEQKIVEDEQSDLVERADNLNVVRSKSAEVDTNTNKIEIAKSDLPQERVAEIAIPKPESAKISGSDIATTIPTIESKKDLSEPEVAVKSLWWKKILVRVRRSIEALARQLPEEV